MTVSKTLFTDPRFLEVARELRRLMDQETLPPAGVVSDAEVAHRVQANKPLTRKQREALLARIVEVVLSDSGQPHGHIEAGDGIISYLNQLRAPSLDGQKHIAGHATNHIEQSSETVLSNGLLPTPSLPLPPEAQALRQVTMRQAAEILGVHERTVRRLLQAGELSAVGRGRLTRIPLRDIAAYQQRNRR